MEGAHTPGPWYADKQGQIWRRPPSELYQNGGGVAGDKYLASVNRGWYGEGEIGFPVEANARLIAAAPELLSELQALVTAVRYADPPKMFNGVECHEARVPVEFIEGAEAAIAKAKGAA